jgi:hypothetical protein
MGESAPGDTIDQGSEVMDREVVRDEMEQAKQNFHRLLDSATVGELSRPSNGTKWTNGQLLFQMLFGYLIVVRLLVLVRIFGRLSDGVSRAFAGTLEASANPSMSSTTSDRLAGQVCSGTRGWVGGSTRWSTSCCVT